jgi:hypothetical protein
MTILQRIINKPAAHISEPSKDVVIVDNTEQETVDLNYDFLSPPNEAFMKNVPTKTFNISTMDISLFFYGYLLRAEQLLADAWEGVSYIWQYRTEIKTAKAIAKDHKQKQKDYVKEQVRAMVPCIVQFNQCNSCWVEGLSGDTLYQVRNQHKTIKNRNISRHWASNTQQAVS